MELASGDSLNFDFREEDWISPITHRHAYIFCLTTTSQVPIVISVQIYMCTKDRNVYIKFVRVSNNLYYYARYLLR